MRRTTQNKNGYQTAAESSRSERCEKRRGSTSKTCCRSTTANSDGASLQKWRASCHMRPTSRLPDGSCLPTHATQHRRPNIRKGDKLIWTLIARAFGWWDGLCCCWHVTAGCFVDEAQIPLRSDCSCTLARRRVTRDSSDSEEDKKGRKRQRGSGNDCRPARRKTRSPVPVAPDGRRASGLTWVNARRAAPARSA